MFERERKFVDLYKQTTGLELRYEAAIFYVEMKNELYRYRPDFYCATTNTWFEVVGTRQAYSATKDKIAAFKVQFPNLTFKLVRPDGTPHTSRPRKRRRKPKPYKLKVKGVLVNADFKTLERISTFTDIPYQTLMRLAASSSMSDLRPGQGRRILRFIEGV